MNSDIVSLINQSAGNQIIKETALRNGMVSLTDNAIELARKGITSIEEVLTVRVE